MPGGEDGQVAGGYDGINCAIDAPFIGGVRCDDENGGDDGVSVCIAFGEVVEGGAGLMGIVC